MRTEQSHHPDHHSWFLPIDPPPAHGPEPLAPVFSPVRDKSRLGATEDLDREPDGVPHSIVGATAGFAVMLAILVASVWFVSSWPMRVAVLILVFLATPVIITSLTHKSDRERDHVHPSR